LFICYKRKRKREDEKRKRPTPTREDTNIAVSAVSFFDLDQTLIELLRLCRARDFRRGKERGVR
jgi:hypothetical protein